jgi:DNA end-binding protein Ku
VKAFKYKGKYVVLSDKDFQRASPKKTSVIEITDFVNEDEVESIYFEQPYYLVPNQSGTRAYALLREALTKSKKAGVGSFVLRNKEHLCIMKPMKNVIVLNTMRYPEEIRNIKDLSLPKAVKPKPAELKMAMALIDQLTGDLDLSKFKDTYSDELMKVIRAKAKSKGKEEEEEYPKLKVSHRKTEDLMAQLKASIKKAS